MAYDSAKPADDEYLSAFPAEAREQLRAIIEDQIVNALKLQGLVPGNASGQLPVSNGNVNTNLNADQVDGKDASYFSPSTHVHADATTNADGFMSMADKTKLDGVATGAEVNQNAFSNVAVGSVTIQADGKQDTLTIAQGANITITADATNDKLTVAVSGTVPNAAVCTGNAATATKWQTARKIGGVSVDGSADVDLPGVNTAGTQDTTGNSATSTKANNDSNGQNISSTYIKSLAADSSSTDLTYTKGDGTTGAVSNFGRAILNNLASKVLASTISSITSDSLMAKLVKLVFNATGVRYNIAQNGYVKFGDFFGGLIIQWGINLNTTNRTVTFPIAMNQDIMAKAVSCAYCMVYVLNESKTGFAVRSFNVDGTGYTGNLIFTWICMGY